MESRHHIRPSQGRKYITRYWLQLGNESAFKKTAWYSEISVTRTQGIVLFIYKNVTVLLSLTCSRAIATQLRERDGGKTWIPPALIL